MPPTAGRRALLPILATLLAVALSLPGCGGGGGGGAAAPVTPPLPAGIQSVTPAGGSVDVPVNTLVSVVTTGSVASVTVLVSGPGGPVPGTTTTVGAKTVFTPAPTNPTRTLDTNAAYTVDVTVMPTGAVVTPVTAHLAFTTAAFPSLYGSLVPDNSLAGASMAGLTIRDVYPGADNQAIQLVTFVSGEGGRYAFNNLIEGGVHYLVADDTLDNGARVIGIRQAPLYVSGWLRDVTVSNVTPTAAASRLTNYCVTCHGPGTVRCTHASKCGFNLDNSVIAAPPSNRMDPWHRMDCEACHTVHLPSGFQFYLTFNHFDTAGSCNATCH